MNGLFTTLRESIEKRQRKVDAVSSPIDFSQILGTVKKLKSALIDVNILNTSLVKKNNSLQVELSFMPREMRGRITPPMCAQQRTDPHYLIPDGNRFVFQRANQSDPNIAGLQTCSYYHSIGDLLKEADDVMRTINLPGTQTGVDQESDHEDQGSNTLGASTSATPTAPSAQIATIDGEPKGANKRAHDSIVTSGHKVHATRAQKLSQSDDNNQSSSVAATFVNGPMLQYVVTNATVRTKPVQNIATPTRQSSSSIPVAEATAVTEAETTQVELFKNVVRKYRSAQGLPPPTFIETPTAEVLPAPATHAYRDAPQYPHSTFSRYQSRYDYTSSRGDVPSQDDYYGNVDAYGNPRNYHGNRIANFAVSKGKGKGKFPNPKGKRNAAPKEWDADYVVIPEFGIAQGMSFYTLNNLLTPGQSTYLVRTPKVINKSLVPGHSIEGMSDREIRMRTNPSDLNQDGSPIHNVVFHYNNALRAIYEVRQSVQNFHVMEETGRIVDLMGQPISNAYPTDPHYLLEENQKLSLGDF
jgi:hypothetical protein